jgi:hypothetical protein
MRRCTFWWTFNQARFVYVTPAADGRGMSRANPMWLLSRDGHGHEDEGEDAETVL